MAFWRVNYFLLLCFFIFHTVLSFPSNIPITFFILTLASSPSVLPDLIPVFIPIPFPGSRHSHSDCQSLHPLSLVLPSVLYVIAGLPSEGCHMRDAVDTVPKWHLKTQRYLHYMPLLSLCQKHIHTAMGQYSQMLDQKQYISFSSTHMHIFHAYRDTHKKSFTDQNRLQANI